MAGHVRGRFDHNFTFSQRVFVVILEDHILSTVGLTHGIK
jgi:hypothetical protein